MAVASRTEQTNGLALLFAVPRGLGFDQALKPVGERSAILLSQPLSRRFDGWFHAHAYRGFPRFRLRLFHAGAFASK
jgi:hypothetical protein